MTIYGRSEKLVSSCIECDLAEPESLTSLGGSAPGLVDGIMSIIYEENGEQAIILKFITLLYNFRVQSVGINQILNHYMPSLSKDARYLLSV